MTKEKKGIWNSLKLPIIYDFVQNLIGGDRPRRILVDEYIRPKANMKILDIGCGTGKFIEWLPADVNYTGFDFNKKLYRFS